MHDALCRTADEIFENQRDMIDTKIRYESDGDEEDETRKEAAPSASTEPTVDGVEGGIPKATSINKDKQHPTTVLGLDDFAIGASDSASSIRYMSDWGGTLHDVDGYSSGAYDEADDEDFGDLGDKYFEKRRHEGYDDEESSEGEPEVVHVEAEENEQDTFMEVSTGSQAIQADSTPNSMSIVEDTFDDGGGSGEEDMEEIM